MTSYYCSPVHFYICTYACSQVYMYIHVSSSDLQVKKLCLELHFFVLICDLTQLAELPWKLS